MCHKSPNINFLDFTLVSNYFCIYGELGVLGDELGGEKMTALDEAANSKDISKGVRVTYSGIGMSADTYIEARCFQAKSVTEGKITGSLIVATDDNLIRTVAVSAGAVLVGSERIVNELKVVRKAIMYKLESAIAKETGTAMRHPSLHGKHEEITFKMGKFEVVDKRNTKNTRQERYRKKIGEKKAARERMLNSLMDEGKIDEEKAKINLAPNPSISIASKSDEVTDVSQVDTVITNKKKLAENNLLSDLVEKFENPGERDSPKATLNEYYQITQKHSINLKNQYYTRCKSENGGTIWNAEFTCPITNADQQRQLEDDSREKLKQFLPDQVRQIKNVLGDDFDKGILKYKITVINTTASQFQM